MQKEKFEEILKSVLKVLKILAALVAFMLGLLNEGASISEGADDPDVEQLSTVGMSCFGFLIAAFSGWPCLYALGGCLRLLTT